MVLVYAGNKLNTNVDAPTSVNAFPGGGGGSESFGPRLARGEVEGVVNCAGDEGVFLLRDALGGAVIEDGAFVG